MSRRIIPYPRINSNEALRRLGVDVSWDLQSSNGKIAFDALNECQYHITDKVWFPDSSPLKVMVSGNVRNAIRLFDGVAGNVGCAVANRESLVGIAFQWRLPKTGLQGAIHCKDISFSQAGELKFGAALEFPPMTIRFVLEIDVVLYLKDHLSRGRDIYANTKGALLGPIARFVLLTGGSGGYFPTEVEAMENGPLWRIHSDINDVDDFKEDFSSQYFCLLLNSKHPLFDSVYVTSKGDKVCLSPLMFEIFANSCFVFIRKACKFLQDVSWELQVDEKDDPSILVNFKALKRRILGGFSRKEIIEMEDETLLLEIRRGLISCVSVDCEEVQK